MVQKKLSFKDFFLFLALMTILFQGAEPFQRCLQLFIEVHKGN